ncbi:MAG TPA: hypothetical protein VD864_17750, partial [Nocardioides sp.]|nr:hypothetical protein [Nocardioides sp.]
MSTDVSMPIEQTPIAGVTTIVDRKPAVLFGLATVGLALILLLAGISGDTTFRLATDADWAELPAPTVPAAATAWLLVVVCALCTVASVSLLLKERRTPMWLVVLFAVAWLVGFLTWAAAGATIPVVGLLAGSLALAVPLVFGALGGVLGERSGVVNIAIDGQLLA